MSAQRIMSHKLIHNLLRQVSIKAHFHVNRGQFLTLKWVVGGEFFTLALDVGLFGVCLRADGNILTGRHRHRSRHQAGNACDQSPIESLSDRELEVFTLIGQAQTTSAIAKQLHLSVHTIDTYREKLKIKLNLPNSAELNRYAVQWVLENG